MAGNNTLATLRGNVRDYLNEPVSSSSFWSDAQLNKYINFAYRKYADKWTRIQPQWGKRTVDITFPADSEYTDLDSSTWLYGGPWRLDSFIEDRTYGQPGYRIPWANSKEELFKYYNGIRDELVVGTNLVAWIEEFLTGTGTSVLRLYLAPKPGSSRSLRLHFQVAAEELSSDTDTTKLPTCVEECVELDAVIRARGIQEEAPPQAITLAKTMLAEAEREMKAFARQFQRGPSRVRFSRKTVG